MQATSKRHKAKHERVVVPVKASQLVEADRILISGKVYSVDSIEVVDSQHHVIFVSANFTTGHSQTRRIFRFCGFELLYHTPGVPKTLRLVKTANQPLLLLVDGGSRND